MINWVRTSQILRIAFSIACIELLLFSTFGFQPTTKTSSSIPNMQQRAYAQNETIEEFSQQSTAAELNGTIEEFSQQPTAADLNGTIEEFPQQPTAADLNGTIEEFPQQPTAADLNGTIEEFSQQPTAADLNGTIEEFPQEVANSSEGETFSLLNAPPLQSIQPSGNEAQDECDPNAELLAVKAKGPLVTRLQNILIEKGFDPGVVDGIFGPKTKSAVEQFQEVNGLVVDGMVGSQTWSAICNSPVAPPPPPPGAECVPDTESLTAAQQSEISSNATTPFSSMEGATVCGELPSPIGLLDCPSILDPSKKIQTRFETYNQGPWKFDFGIVDGEGLVLKNIMAGEVNPVPLIDRFSVPHFKLDFFDGTSKIVRFCGSKDFHMNAPFPHFGIEAGKDFITWFFTRDLDSGKLRINYEVVIRHSAVNNCELQGADCFRLIPKVSFEWIGKNEECQGLKPGDGVGDECLLDKFTAFYRIDYGGETGLTLVKDSNAIPGPAGKADFVEKERFFRAVDNGMEGVFDNIHSGHVGQIVTVPGCRDTEFDCFHMHWRWGDVPNPVVIKVDPLVEPSDDTRFDSSNAGTPYLTPGQTIDIAVLKSHPSNWEMDPDDPESLVNRESIAENFESELLSAEQPIVWYIASADDTHSDTFFRHGIFILDCDQGCVPFPLN